MYSSHESLFVKCCEQAIERFMFWNMGSSFLLMKCTNFSFCFSSFENVWNDTIFHVITGFGMVQHSTADLAFDCPQSSLTRGEVPLLQGDCSDNSGLWMTDIWVSVGSSAAISDLMKDFSIILHINVLILNVFNCHIQVDWSQWLSCLVIYISNPNEFTWKYIAWYIIMMHYLLTHSCKLFSLLTAMQR